MVDGIHAVRRYERGGGMERETCSLSYLESSGFVRCYYSEHGARCETQCGEWPAPDVATGREVFGREHAKLIDAGWREMGTQTSGTDANREQEPKPR